MRRSRGQVRDRVRDKRGLRPLPDLHCDRRRLSLLLLAQLLVLLVRRLLSLLSLLLRLLYGMLLPGVVREGKLHVLVLLEMKRDGAGRRQKGAKGQLLLLLLGVVVVVEVPTDDVLLGVHVVV